MTTSHYRALSYLGLFLTASALRAISPATLPPAYSAADLDIVQQQAADRALEVGLPKAVIAIVDRDGRVILLRRADGSADPITATEKFRAVTKAGTAVFLSSNEQAFTPRTALFIIQQNFPPGVRNRPPGPLVGVGFSNLAYSDINYFREVDNTTRIPLTRLTGSPGGVPLYKNGRLFAGVGVFGDGIDADFETEANYSLVNNRADLDEAVALAGQLGYAPDARILATNVLIDGIRVPYVSTSAQSARPPFAGSAPLVPATPPPAPITYPVVTLGGVTGELRPRTGVQAGAATATVIGDPAPGLISGQARLSAAEVEAILALAATRSQQVRAGIRLPAGRPAQVFISVVNNPANGTAPIVLGTFRTPDATLFSWDVSVQKARTAVFYTRLSGLAFSSRAVGFLAQKHYPPGIAGRAPGLYNGQQETFSLRLLDLPGTVLPAPLPPLPEPALPNGTTIFPGGFPLYRNGILVGAIGISGDGIEHDDLIGYSGQLSFAPPPGLRADNFVYLNARLPYAKFPRDSEVRNEPAPYVAGP
jgi:uncharacterized protein GlcG (DUF336 family)